MAADTPMTGKPVRALKARRPDHYVDKTFGPKLPDNWEAVFFEQLNRRGGYAKAARLAGVSYRTVLRRREDDPAFEERCRECIEFHADELEEQLEDKGGYVGQIVRLKALRPAQYIERNMTMSLNVSTTVPDELGADLLRAMLTEATPATRAILEGRVLEAHGEDVTP